jgi:dinuclear metal center protein, YbgI/SA1388 family
LQRVEFEKRLKSLLTPHLFRDYAPNGLQVEGKDTISKVVTGVTASQALIDRAIELEADALVVHHGYFWKGEAPEIKGMKYRRISALIKNDINLFGYHLPLDAHPTYGNNSGLAVALSLSDFSSLEQGKPLNESIGLVGELAQPESGLAFKARVEKAVGRDVLFEQTSNAAIKRVALCTGGAQGYITKAVECDADVFITGEVSEKTIHEARELGIHFIAAGHHATERFGPMGLAEFISEELGLDAEFVDIDNPA